MFGRAKERHRFSGALILNVIYGYNVSGDNDLFVKNAEAAFTPFQAERLARLFMVDYFPICKWIILSKSSDVGIYWACTSAICSSVVPLCRIQEDCS